MQPSLLKYAFGPTAWRPNIYSVKRAGLNGGFSFFATSARGGPPQTRPPMLASLLGGRLGSARRPDPAPDSPQSDGEEQLMSRDGTFKQTAIAGATPFSSYNPDNSGIPGLPGSWLRPMGLGRELVPVPGSAANSLPSAWLPPVKPSSEARAAVGTRFTFEDAEDVGQMPAAPMDEARPALVDEIAEDEEPVRGGGSVVAASAHEGGGRGGERGGGGGAAGGREFGLG